jgi:hypothetical protein
MKPDKMSLKWIIYRDLKRVFAPIAPVVRIITEKITDWIAAIELAFRKVFKLVSRN